MHTDANGVIINCPAKPASALAFVVGGDILCDWHTMALKQVTKSIDLQLKCVDDPVHHQNLVWTFQHLMDGLGANLKMFIFSKILNLSPNIGN